MKKLFIYNVDSEKFADSVAFGEAWKKAKEKATEKHCAIFRKVIANGEEREQVFYKGNVFNSINFMTKENVMIF